MKNQLQPVIPSQYLLQLFESNLLSTEAYTRLKNFFEQQGYQLTDLAQTQGRIPLHWAELALEALTIEHAAHLAFRFGQQVRLTTHGGLSILLMASSTIRESLVAFSFLPVLSKAVHIQFIETEEAGYILLYPQTNSVISDQFPLYYAASAIPRLIHLLTGQHCHATMQLSHAQPFFIHNCQEQFGLTWQFNAPTNAFILSKKILDLPCLFGDPIVFSDTKNTCERLLNQQMNRVELPLKVKQLIRANLREAQQEKIAQSLHLSVSTLKRQLAHYQTNFHDLLDEVRKQQAVSSLLQSELSLPQIAEQLGYSEQSNFAHAFKRWTGFAPSNFRQALQTKKPH